MLKNKNAVVTGATRGIGREIAFTLAENGANVAINYRTLNEDVERLEFEAHSGFFSIVYFAQSKFSSICLKIA